MHSTPFYLALLVRLDSRCGQNQLERGQAVPSRPSTFQPISHRTFSGQHVASPILRGVASHDCSQRFGSTHSHGSARPQPAGISICSKSLHGQSGYSFCCGRRSYASTCVPRSTLPSLQCSCLLDPLRLRPALQDEPRRAKRVWGPSLAASLPRTPPLLCDKPARVCASACACNGGGLCQRMCLHKSPLQAQALAQAPPARELARLNFMLKNIKKKLLRRKLHSGIQKPIENQILYLAE